MHTIDLKKYEIRTDMAIDLAEKSNCKYKSENYVSDGVKVSWLRLDENNDIGKAAGTYLTLEFNDVTDTDLKNKLSEVLKEELGKMLSKIGFNKSFNTLIIGLGNLKSTPDSLGPKTTDKIIVTKHLYDMKINVDSKFTNVSIFNPGVTGTTGIETSDLIKGIINETKPDLILAVDALASTSISRVNKSIQISDTGISPGSGIGNKRKEISTKTLEIPVIAIGIPTVVNASVIVSDTINYMFKNYAYNKNNLNSKINKFINEPVNYLKKDLEITDEDKKTLFGLVGMLSEDELKELTYEVLTPIGYNLMVTPKEIDFTIEKLSDVLSYGINHSLHNL